MKRIACFVLVLTMIASLFTGCKMKKTKYNDYSFDYFDTVTTITGLESNKEEFYAKCKEIKALLEEYHKLYDIYNAYEGINNLHTVNQLVDGKHVPVKVDKKIINLLTFAEEMYIFTGGKLNVAMGSVLKIWHKYREEGLSNPNEAKLPEIEVLKSANGHTVFDDIIVNKAESTVYISDDEMSIDVGAIAKGYVAEKIAKWMIGKKYYGYVINIGGNVRTIKRDDGEKWKVGIENPDTEDTENPYIETLKFDEMSLVTSGSYQRFYMVDGKSYHHIIDSETLMPAQNFKSVSVICADSGVADALSTTLFCMSHEEGLELLEHCLDTEVMWVLPSGKRLYTDGFKKYCEQQ